MQKKIFVVVAAMMSFSCCFTIASADSADAPSVSAPVHKAEGASSEKSEASVMKQLLQQKKYDAVIERAETALNKNPKNVMARRLRAEAYMKQLKYEDAEKDFSQVLVFEPKNWEVMLLRSQCYDKMNKPEAAQRDRQAVVALQPKTEAQPAVPFVVRPQTVQPAAQTPQVQMIPAEHPAAQDAPQGDNTGKRLQEIQAYNQLEQIGKANASIYLARGEAYLDLKKYAAAAEDFKRVIKLEPTNAAAYNNIGRTLMWLGQPEPAIQNFSKAITYKQDYLEAIRNRGEVYLNLGRYSEAEVDFNRCLQLKADDSRTQDLIEEMKVKIGK